MAWCQCQRAGSGKVKECEGRKEKRELNDVNPPDLSLVGIEKFEAEK